MNCRKCGTPLTKGNIRVVRRKGKRAVRECRRCPDQAREDMLKRTGIPAIDLAKTEAYLKVKTTEQAWPNGNQGPQDTREGPVTVDLVLDFTAPPRYRYFMTQDTAARVKDSLARILIKGFGIGFEVIPVTEAEIEQDPEAYADLVEVTVDWKVHNE